MTDQPQLTVLVSICADQTCPTVYDTGRGTRIVQGDTVARDAIPGLPAHESAIEIPAGFYDEIGRSWARNHHLLP